ncbi:MAG: NUDIX domain-containing protein [Anaerolineae bacterium]|nr:NUDIX domain-containing protein [Anaerolineae bacterium]
MTTQSSSVVVFNDDHHVLLILREDARLWALPAGRLEPGETFEQAAIREAREETGYEIELERLVGEYWRPQFPHGGDRQRVFAGRVVGGNPSEHDWESLEVKWFPLSALPRRLFRFSGEHIQDACAHSKTPFEKEQRFSRPETVFLSCFFLWRRVRNLLLGRKRDKRRTKGK